MNNCSMTFKKREGCVFSVACYSTNQADAAFQAPARGELEHAPREGSQLIQRHFYVNTGSETDFARLLFFPFFFLTQIQVYFRQAD